MNAIARLFPLRIAEYQARLEGQAGFTGRGGVHLKFSSHGGVYGEIDLRGIAGLSAALYLAGRHVVDIPLNNGRAVFRFNQRKLGREISATTGDMVDIRQNGDIILRGALVDR